MKLGTMRVLVVAGAGVMGAIVPAARAATVADTDVLGPSQTVTVSSTFSNAAFTGANLVDGTNGSFVFSDSDANEAVSISGFNSSIDSLRFFDTPSYTGRTAGGVTIYYSPTNQTVLTPASYTLLGTFTLPKQAGNADFYQTDTSPVDHPKAGDPSVNTGLTIHFDTLTGLGIPAGTRSLLLTFAKPANGAGLTEIQAFVPEPASVALAAAGGLLLLRRRTGGR